MGRFDGEREEENERGGISKRGGDEKSWGEDCLWGEEKGSEGDQGEGNEGSGVRFVYSDNLEQVITNTNK